MRPIHKFILHVVHNWKNELNEAYSEKAIQQFLTKFKEEADDLNINITDEQLKKYIERFDVIKNSPKIQEKDLNKWTLGALIRLVTSSPGAEVADEEEDRTPDVVYQDNGITIWNGSKEDNCITYGRGERWCITRGSYGNYRYSEDRGYPTFYLAKNSNISDSNPLSFVAIQVRDVPTQNRRYVYTNRKNSPYESPPMGFDGLMSEVPWLRDIPNIQNILKYIPLSNQEKASKTYKNKAISIREWIKLPFEVKKQYLVARKNTSSLFDDISVEQFIRKYLPNYPQIASFIAVSPGIITPMDLLGNLDAFNNQDRRSITANLQTKIDLAFLKSDELSFDVKKLLTVLNKWNTTSIHKLYVTKDGSTIVHIKIGDDISLGLYQAEDDYPNVKLNQRTSKYLLDYPELDKIPFNNMIKLVGDGIVDKQVLDRILEKAKTDENSAIVVKEIDGKEIVIDSNSFASYKIENGRISKIPFNDEDVQALFAGEKDNTSFQDNAVNIINTSIITSENLPSQLDKDAFLSVLKAAPYDKRKYGQNGIIIIPDEGAGFSIFVKYSKIDLATNINYGKDGRDWRLRDTNGMIKDIISWRAYFAYLRNENEVYSDEEILQVLRLYSSALYKKVFIQAQPPLSPTGRYATAYLEADGTAYVVNKTNPRESFKISNISGKLVRAVVSPSLARQLVGATPDEATPTAPAAQAAAPVAGVPRRGRPRQAGVQNVRAPQPAAPAAGGEDMAVVMGQFGLENGWNSLPSNARRRLSAAPSAAGFPTMDRGASRRNNLLGAAGRVTAVRTVGPSAVYFIRLANGTTVASVVIQPGNSHYLATPNGAFVLNSPSDLLQALRQRNLAEIRRYITREYINHHPEHLDEVREMLRQHLEEIRNY